MSEKLSRSSVQTASSWATKYRVMKGGPWSFEGHPWLKDMHDSKAENNIGQKAAQMGYTECMLNLAFYNLDIHSRDVLYILPNQRPDAADFAARAIDPAMQLSPHIKDMFDRGADNVGLKQCGAANFYIRGSNSRSSLKSIPASLLIFDEFEEHDQSLTKLAEERKAGQEYRYDWKISTPMAPGVGINALFTKSTSEEFHFQCPSCSCMIRLTFPHSLVITADDPEDPNIRNSHVICTECKSPIHDKKSAFKKHEWVAKYPGRETRGFHISQLYSTVLPTYVVAKLYLESRSDVVAEQEFYNSKLGLEHLVADSKLTEQEVGALVRGYSMIDSTSKGHLVTLGVDVGRKLHYVVILWDVSEVNPIDVGAKAKGKMLKAGELDTFEQLNEVMINHNISYAIIDAMPETRKSSEFCNNFYGRARMCRYSFHQASKSFNTSGDIEISVNRTSWLDQTMGRYRNGSLILPNNLPRDFVNHVMAPMRVPVRDTNGNTVYKYLTQDGVADHYAHAHNYAEIALSLAYTNNTVENI